MWHVRSQLYFAFFAKASNLWRQLGILLIHSFPQCKTITSWSANPFKQTAHQSEAPESANSPGQPSSILPSNPPKTDSTRSKAPSLQTPGDWPSQRAPHGSPNNPDAPEHIPSSQQHTEAKPPCLQPSVDSSRFVPLHNNRNIVQVNAIAVLATVSPPQSTIVSYVLDSMPTSSRHELA